VGADQIAAILPAIAELVAAAEAREPGHQDLCASFSVPGKSNAWAQVTPGTVNFGFPICEPPFTFLVARGISLPEMSLVSFQMGSYVTFTHGPYPPGVVARFVDAALTASHGLPVDDYLVDVAITRL
jgi:hypothetical protein